MRIDKLQLDLYPRSGWQAIDLGFSLLRLSAGTTYAAWLCLWLPLVACCYVLTLLSGEAGFLWILLSWWLRPLLERVVIYVLSRSVFGEQVSWRSALRAWPRQLGGGWIRLLTLWRPFMPGRGLYQPIWQLENARGKFASERRRVIGRDNAGSTAYWFGLVCAHFEVVLQFGVLALLGLFFVEADAVNPFLLLIEGEKEHSNLILAASYLTYALAGGIIGPIYTACCFTLYLNRRAELEAWDIELILRQLKPRQAHAGAPTGKTGSGRGKLSACLLPLALGLALLHPEPAQAEDCTPPKEVTEQRDKRGTPHNADQARLRQQLETVYAQPDLRRYHCEMQWQPREAAKEEAGGESDFLKWLLKLFQGQKTGKLPETTTTSIKIALIAIAVALLAWLLYRYRDRLMQILQPAPRRPSAPTEIAGLDIRPESLPDDVPAAVRALWTQGQRRAALALLYRATLSQLAHRHDLVLNRGATEGDCLRSAQQAEQRGQLDQTVLVALQQVTGLWLAAAYARQWPNDLTLDGACQQWQHAFGKGAA
ncbi:hypothetical protein [Chitinimonas naiadis]